MPASNQPEPASLPVNDAVSEAAIYVHWPFCEKKCPYCDFNSHVRDTVDQQAWRNAMLREIETFAAHFPNLTASSVFFGGGTPSLMPPETAAAVINAIKEHWSPAGDIEITLEANPSSVEAGRFADYAAAGVNRVSIGVQSFKDTSLKFLGRLHSSQEAEYALKVAQDNFKRISFDLIYALPDQSLEDWRGELGQALDFSPSHLSLYQLTIEEGTAFYHQFRRGKFNLPGENEAAALFELTQDMTEAAGLPAYETSNHARSGQQSQHNLAYWRGDPYVGIGPGAHGRLPGQRRGEAFAHHQVKRPEAWLKAVQSNGVALAELETIGADERAVETIMMSLRLREGLSINKFERQFAVSPLTYMDRGALDELVGTGYLTRGENHIAATRKGAPLLNFLLQKLLA